MTAGDDALNGGDASAEARIDRLTRQLPRDIATETDLWIRIVACIDSPSDNALRRLPRHIEAGGDLWPGVRARIEGHAPAQRTARAVGRPHVNAAVAAGVVALLTLGTLITAQFGRITSATDTSGSAVGQVSFREASRLPSPVSDVFDRFENALPGTEAAAVAATALEIRRDLVMTRFERLRIERALAGSSDDRNLRAQWRHVYVAELRLIDAAQNLGKFQLNWSEI